MITHANFTFKPLKESDLELLCIWLNKPHIKAWWNDGLTVEEIKTKYRKRINDKVTFSFLTYLENKPIGLIQYYYADKVGNGWWPEEVEGTIGIDQFIGEENYSNQGYGTKMISEFIKKLFEDSAIKKIITDVDPRNHRAIRCYEKVGFVFVSKIVIATPDGPAYLMNMYRNEKQAVK